MLFFKNTLTAAHMVPPTCLLQTSSDSAAKGAKVLIMRHKHHIVEPSVSSFVSRVQINILCFNMWNSSLHFLFFVLKEQTVFSA